MINVFENTEGGMVLAVKGRVIDARIKKRQQDPHYKITVVNWAESELFRDYRLSDVPNISSLRLATRVTWSKDLKWIVFQKREQRVLLGFFVDLMGWSRGYSCIEYIEAVVKQDPAIDRDGTRLRIHRQGSKGKPGFVIEIAVDFQDASIGSITESTLHMCRDWLQEIETGLLVQTGQVRTFFNFPEPLKTACVQYLHYFVQFLKDLGLSGTQEITEDAGRILFSVTPSGSGAALTLIREALAIYLKLPESPIICDDSVKSMRLQQQIYSLQHSQKMAEMEFRLAHKVIESQEGTIRQKDLIIDQQSNIIEKILSKSIMIDSAENSEELEEVFEGVKIGRSKFLAEQFGLVLNPATALKSVGKRLFGKVELTSLHLEEDVEDA